MCNRLSQVAGFCIILWSSLEQIFVLLSTVNTHRWELMKPVGSKGWSDTFWVTLTRLWPQLFLKCFILLKLQWSPSNPMAHIDNINENKLNRYDGTDPNLPILVTIRGKIYIVPNGESFYRSGGSCVVFTGKDASHARAKMPTKPEDLSADLDGSNRQGDPCTWWSG